jgi:hypothetical protein
MGREGAWVTARRMENTDTNRISGGSQQGGRVVWVLTDAPSFLPDTVKQRQRLDGVLVCSPVVDLRVRMRFAAYTSLCFP